MKERFYRFSINCFQWFKKIFNMHKGWIFSFGIVFLISFITGIMTCVNYLDVISCENLINKYLLNLLTKSSTYLTFFLMMLLWLSLVFIFSIFITKSTFIVVCNFLIFALMSYVWGFDICIVIMTLGLAGVVYGVLILGVLGVFLFFIVILMFSILCKKYYVLKKNCNRDINNNYLKLYIILFLVGLVILFVLSILFSSIHIFVIVD